MKLLISKDLSLPTDVVTQVIAILAKRRAGKSYTMRRIVEQLFKADQQVVIVDPKGDQWGLRSSADGKKPGVPVLILGGEHGDLPLEVNSGEVVARLVVQDQVSVLLDVSHFRKHEVATFMTAFMENLYRLKAQEKYRTPLMLVVDEADAIAPQKPQKGEERMLGAIEDIVRRGGQRGIGCILVTQRSAVLNKNVLTQAQILVVLRTIAPQDLAAMKAWVDVHGSVEEGKILMDSLPSLPIGDAWFWSPGYPTEEGIFKRIHVAPIETFDSGATPKPGQKRIVPKNLADVDLDALKGQMSATIEKAKAEDPKTLKAEIKRLTGELERKNVEKGVKDTPMGVSQWREYGKKYGYYDFFEKQIMQKAGLEWEKVVKEKNSIIAAYKKGCDIVLKLLNEMNEAMDKRGISNVPLGWLTPSNLEQGSLKVGDIMPIRTPDIIAVPKAQEQVAREIFEGEKGIVIAGKTRELLQLLASHYPNEITRSKAALLAQIKQRASTFRNSVSRLKVAGLIELRGDSLVATQAGMDFLGATPEAPKSPEEIRAKWRSTFSGATLKMFDVIVDAYETYELSRSLLAEKLEIDPNVSTFRNSLSKLRVTGVITEDGDIIRASSTLF